MKNALPFLWYILLAAFMASCRVSSYPPEVWTVQPEQARIGTEITITGAKFGTSPIVTFGQSETAVAATVKAASNQSITAVVPQLPAGQTSIQVSTDEGISEPHSFTVLQPGPLITAIQPTNGLPGTTLRISGNFLNLLKDVRLGNVSIKTFTDTTQNTITFAIPAGMPLGPTSLLVETTGGASNTDFLVAGQPEISSFSPRQIRSGMELVIQGRNLSNGLVRLGGVSVDPARTIVKDTEIRTYVPASVPSGRITVTVFERLTATSTDSLLVVSAPSISNLSLAEGIKGDQVVITGQNLKAINRVLFGTIEVPFQIRSDTQIEATVPELAQAGNVTIRVSSVGGDATSPAPFFLILPPASLTVSPVRQIRGGEVVVSGVNLHRISGVKLGNNAAPISARTEGTSLRITVPAEATSGPITVTNRAGSATATQPVVVIQKPVISTFTNKVPVGGRVALKGDFLLNAQVLFAGSTAATAFDGKNTDEEIWVKVPASAKEGPICVTNEAGTVCTTIDFTLK